MSAIAVLPRPRRKRIKLVVVNLSGMVLETAVRGGGTIPFVRIFSDVSTSVSGELGSQVWSVTPQVVAEGACSFVLGFLEELVYELIPPNREVTVFKKTINARKLWRMGCRAVYGILFAVKIGLFIAAIPTMGASLLFFLLLEVVEAVICYLCNRFGRALGRLFGQWIRKKLSAKHIPDKIAVTPQQKEAVVAALNAKVDQIVQQSAAQDAAFQCLENCRLELGVCSICSVRPCNVFVLHEVKGGELGDSHPFCSECVNRWIVEKKSDKQGVCPGCTKHFDLLQGVCAIPCQHASLTALVDNPCFCVPAQASCIIAVQPNSVEVMGCETCYNPKFQSYKIKPL